MASRGQHLPSVRR
ncbi:hypothetical protein LINPERPRIM_LOCUS36719 [Linum perenne]